MGNALGNRALNSEVLVWWLASRGWVGGGSVPNRSRHAVHRTTDQGSLTAGRPAPTLAEVPELGSSSLLGGLRRRSWLGRLVGSHGAATPPKDRCRQGARRWAIRLAGLERGIGSVNRKSVWPIWI